MAKPLELFMGIQTLGCLTTPQQSAPNKFKVSSVAGFKPRTMYQLLGLHFPVFTLTNWITLASNHSSSQNSTRNLAAIHRS